MENALTFFDPTMDFDINDYLLDLAEAKIVWSTGKVTIEWIKK